MAGAPAGWSQVAADDKQGLSGAIIVEKGEDQPIEPMMRHRQLRVSKQLYKRSADCVAAKLDIWIHDGRIEYVVFAPDNRGKRKFHRPESSNLRGSEVPDTCHDQRR
jgi:hypothetical protein